MTGLGEVAAAISAGMAILNGLQKRAEEAKDDDLLSQVKDLRERALRVLGAAEEAGDLRAAMGAIREARGCLELLGRVTGELVEKHAHLHAVVPQAGPSEEARRSFEAMPEDERRVLQLIAQRMALRNPENPNSFPPIGEKIRELLDPQVRERHHVELRTALADH